MAREVRTDLIISGKTRGFAEVQQQTARVAREASKIIDNQVKGFETSGKSMQVVEGEVKRLEKVLQGLATRQASINQLMEKSGDKGSDQYKALAAELKKVDQEAGRVTRTIGNLDRAFSRRREQRQGFVQGLAQGVAPGAATFLQRGPGMRRQMAGQAIGGLARGGARAAGTALTGGLFMGAEGLAQGISQIPIVGGFLGAQAQRAIQQAQMSMQAQQVQLQTMPFLGGVGLRQQMRRAGEQARQTMPDQEIERQAQRDRIHQSLLPSREHYLQAQAEARARQTTHKGEKPKGPSLSLTSLAAYGIASMTTPETTDPLGRPAGTTDDIEARAMELSGLEAEERTRGNLQRERARRVRTARRTTQRRALGLGGGTQFGMDINAERQFRAQVQQAGGGFGITAQERQMGMTAMAAQTAFGVGGGVSGAFLQAGRRGGLAGAEGGASRMLTDSLADAMKMGLEGSEINDYLQQMASGITSWKTTGIPFNKQSMADIAGTLGTMGMGGVRGMAVAGGVSRAAEQLSRTGPQSVGQLMMLQTLGGLRPGQTGMEAMEDALIRLEKKQFAGEDFQKMIQGLLQAGGGGAEGRRVAYGVLQQAGIQISREELRAIDEGADPETLKKIREERERGTRMAKRTAESPEALARAAAEAVPNALKRQAALTNKQIANGVQLTGTMKNLEETAQKFTKMFTEAIAPLVADLSENLKKFATGIEQTTAKAGEGEAVETGPT